MMVLLTSVIDTFVDHEYRRAIPYLEKLASKVEKICKNTLNEANIQYVTSSRVKDPERLRAKLKKQELTRGVWKENEDIWKNVIDFVGVRIALYRPEDDVRVDRILKENFVILPEDTKDFGKPTDSDETLAERKSTTPRYKAVHYVVQLKAKDFETLYPLKVEVQVMSVLQSSWAQIEHDLTYKQLSGRLSTAEKSSLDSLGRVMELGESFLYQLSDIQNGRIRKAAAPFKNIYELGNFLSEWFLENYKTEVKDLGSLNALKGLLEKKEWSSRQALSNILNKLHPNSENPMYAAQKRFPNIELRPTVFIIDYIVFKHDQHGNVDSWDKHREEMRCKAKLEIIMSTILWLSDFFAPPHWENALKSEGTAAQNDVRIKRLSWLASVRPEQLIDDYEEFRTNPNDRENVEQLWDWFNNHHNRAIQLAFHISKYVEPRDLTKESCQFTRVFATLGQTLRADFRKHHWRSIR